MHHASRHVSLDQLRYFVALANEQHFTRAAEKCNIAQPPFSRSIAKLEQSLKTTLVIRKTRSVELTQAGILFAERANQILSMLDDAVISIHTEQIGQSRLRLGMLEYAFTVLGPQFMEAFSSTHPTVQLKPVDLPPEHLTFSVTHGNVDLQFAALSERDRLPVRLGLREVVIITEPIAILVDANHTLAQKTEISILELAAERLVLFERSRAPDVYRAVMQSFSDQGIRVNIDLEVGFFQTMLAAVRATQRVGLVPLSASSLVSSEMKVLPIRATDVPHIRLSLVWNESRESLELLEFVKWVIEQRPNTQRRQHLHHPST